MGYPPTGPATWPGGQYIKGNCREQVCGAEEATEESGQSVIEGKENWERGTARRGASCKLQDGAQPQREREKRKRKINGNQAKPIYPGAGV